MRKALPFNTPITTNDQSLDRVLNNPLPVLLALSGNGLDPALQAALEKVAHDQAGKLIVAKVNTTENPQVARRFHTDGDVVLISWKGTFEESRITRPLPDQVGTLANHVLGQGPAPRVARPAEPTAQTGTSAGGTSGEPVTVSEANFGQEVIRYSQPVLVDFWAPWCGPCRMVAPTLEKLAREYAGRLRIAKLNVDQNQNLAMQYGVQGIPMLIVFKGGKPVQELVGAHPEANIRRVIEHVLSM